MKTYISLFLMAFILQFTSCSDGGIESAPTIRYKPAAVTDLIAVAGVSSVILTWNHTDNKTTDFYEITSSPSGESTITVNKELRSYTVENLTNGVEHTFTLVAKNEEFSSDVMRVTATPKSTLVISHINSFKFTAAQNPDMALNSTDVADITTAVIDKNAKTVTIEGLSAYTYLDNLIPLFTTSDGAVLTVAGNPIESGVTALDFTKDVPFVLTTDGDATIYTIKVNKSQFAEIPDAAFAAHLKVMNNSQFAGAFNEDGKMDILHPSILDFSNQLKLDYGKDGLDTKIQSLKGIEFFVNITDLRFEKNAVTSLDLRKNPAIGGLVAGWNKLSYIDASNCRDVKAFYVLGNRELETIDLTNNTIITKLYIDGTAITSIKIDHLAQLQSLRIDIETAEASLLSLKKLLDIVDEISFTAKYFKDESPDVDTSKDYKAEEDLTYTPNFSGIN